MSVCVGNSSSVKLFSMAWTSSRQIPARLKSVTPMSAASESLLICGYRESPSECRCSECLSFLTGSPAAGSPSMVGWAAITARRLLFKRLEPLDVFGRGHIRVEQ